MLLTLLLPASVLLSQVSAQVNTKSYVTCLTRQGTKSTALIKTTSNVLTLPWYAFKTITSTPSTTSTPDISITTSTSVVISTTTTILPTITDTATATAQTTATITSIADTSTTVVTSESLTTVTITGTTTVPAPAGFIPVESSFAGAMKRRADAAPADAPALQERAATGSFHIENGKHVCNPAIYPQSVNCVGLVALVNTIIRTKTASSTQTVVAPTPIVTSVVTTTSIITITDQPQATTTVTVTDVVTTTYTSTPVVTSTFTITNTVTVQAPQATFYAACAENNIASTLNGQTLFSGKIYNTGSPAMIRGSNPYACCVSCLTSANCGGTIFLQGNCFVYTSQLACSQSNRILAIASTTLNIDSYFVSNGPCGFIDGNFNA